MYTLVGILVLLIGVAFPMGMLVWLNGRLRQQPALQPRQVGMLLALNGILPLGLVIIGLWLVYPPFGTSMAIKATVIVSALAVLVLLAGLWWAGRAARRKGERHAR
jgi:hypothetical protein